MACGKWPPRALVLLPSVPQSKDAVVDFVHVMFVVFNVTLCLSENICFTSMSEDNYVVILSLTFLVCC